MNLQIIATVLGIMVGSGSIIGGGYYVVDRFVTVERVVYSLSNRAAQIDLGNLEKLRKRRSLSRVEKQLYCQYGEQLGYWGKLTNSRCPFAVVPSRRAPQPRKR